jgi:hypothetical protein
VETGRLPVTSDSKIRLRVPWDSESRITVLTRASNNSAATIAVQELGYGMDDQRVGIRFLEGAKDNFVSSRPNLGLIDLHMQWASVTVSPGVKLQDRETDHSPPPRAEFRNVGAIPPLLHVCS